MKPGYKTTEFWGCCAAFILGALAASGVLIEGSPIAQAIGLASSALASMGYSYSRAKVKNGEGS